VDAVAAAMAELSSGVASVPQRNAAMVEPVGGALLAMPAYVPGAGALAAKLVGQFPQNPARGLPSHVALIAAFDPETGVPQAVMDGEVITAARTAAGSALSARLLAREDAEVLAILGTGVQARSHARALARVRRLSEMRVAGRDPAKAQALAAELGPELGVPATAAAGYREAIAGGGARAVPGRLERDRLGNPRRGDHGRPRARRAGRARRRLAAGAHERRPDHALQVGRRRRAGRGGSGRRPGRRAGGGHRHR